MKDTDSKDEDTTFCSYDMTYLSQFNFKVNKDFGKNQLFGNTKKAEKFTVKQYVTTDVPDARQTAIVKGFSQDVMFNNATIMVQPATGLIVSKNFTTTNSLML